MKKKIGVLALAVVFAAAAAGEAMAGRGNGGTGSKRFGGGVSATRPADSQRRDGSFQSSGTTANGSTTRPDRGNGLRDGSRLN